MVAARHSRGRGAAAKGRPNLPTACTAPPAPRLPNACGLIALAALTLTQLRAEIAPGDDFQTRALRGGSAATAFDFPFVMGVHSKCSGTLSTMEWIVAAARCIDGEDSLFVTHISGEEIFAYPAYSSVKLIKHPDYDPPAGEFATPDIALIRLEEPLKSSYAQPVRRPSPEEWLRIQPGTMTTVVGPDMYSSVGGAPVHTALTTRGLGPSLPTHLHVNATVEQGDGGGPVLVREGDERTLAGVLSRAGERKAVAQRIGACESWVASRVGIGASKGATVSLDNSSGSDCVPEDWLSLNKAEVVSSENGSVSIEGSEPRTILLAECGRRQ